MVKCSFSRIFNPFTLILGYFNAQNRGTTPLLLLALLLLPVLVLPLLFTLLKFVALDRLAPRSQKFVAETQLQHLTKAILPEGLEPLFVGFQKPLQQSYFLVYHASPLVHHIFADALKVHIPERK